MNIGDELRGVLRGRVLAAGDDGFETARRPWNLAVDQPVRAVVEAADADDVAALVRHARLAGLTVATQPSGHGASGNTGEVILLRTARLDELEVRPAERIARAGAGVAWGRVLAEAGPHGLTGLAGSSPVVTVTGYTLGGGLSWFGRKHGWASGSVRAFDVVDADGARSRVTSGTDPDLFWALRGGGGDFAIVTAVEFDLHPAPRLYGGRMLWPAERAAAVLDAYREVTGGAPDELTTWYELLQYPGAAPMVAVDCTFLGAGGAAEALLRPLDKVGGRISDSRAALPVAELGTITAEPTDPGPGLSRAELLTDLADEVADALLERPVDPLLTVQLRHLGGALARPSGTPAGHLDEPFALYMFGVPGEDGGTSVGDRGRELADALVPYTTGRKPFTLLAPGERAANAFTPGVLARLRELKRTRDPRGVFRSNFPVLS
ncbi:FAD-binding oxidoreductase [Actinomadura livida]|uniref:FAD-binding oxidoreductase n=1 Tax=Actinomadura livida TaxID=79909 RepID=A0A7W7MWF5_9ACTN|nr:MULTISPECIES: FAD-binding oxidoreductase [Actinomadura]MBB4772760.1 FAD/FMN-containing dehydrogenase [Actinomadura catellatispora]GGU12552.1 oxidoreductase [Actinomadura livida]